MLRLFKKRIAFFPALLWGDIAILLGAAAVYVAIASATLTKFSIWFDEAFGSYLVRFNIVDLTRYTANDVHPPLYYWFLKIWTIFFGNTEVGIRSMSVFFGVVTIIAMFLFVLRLFGRKAAYLSLLLLVLSPMFIRYGQEARMYTLLTAIVVVATYVLTYAVQTKKRWAWITYGVFLTLGMLTQYLVALVWAAHFMWLFIAARKPGQPLKASVKRTFTKNVMIAYGTAAALFSLWLPFLVIQFLTIQGHGFWIKPVNASTLTDFIANALLFGDSTTASSWLALGMFLLIGLVAYLAYRLLRSLSGEMKSHYILLLSIVIVPPLLLFLISMPPLRSAFVDRYLLSTVVFLAPFIGVTLVLSKNILSKKVLAGVIAAIIVILTIGIFNQANIGNYNKASAQSNNTRQLIEAIRGGIVGESSPILTTTPWIFYEASIYSQPNSLIYYVNETTEYKYGSLTALAENEVHKIRDLDAFTKTHDEIWVIGNLRDVAPKALRDNWHEKESIIINDDVTKNPLFKAVRFSVE